MTNHVHLLASTVRPYGLSLMMQYAGRHFVRYINRVYRRSGTLWEGRFKASLVDAETCFLRCCRYIERNPEPRWCGVLENIPGQATKITPSVCPTNCLPATSNMNGWEARMKNASGRIANCSAPSLTHESLLRSEIPPIADGRSVAIDSRMRSSAPCNVLSVRPSGAARLARGTRYQSPNNEARNIGSKVAPIYRERHAGWRFTSRRAMMMRCISLVPSPIARSGASR